MTTRIEKSVLNVENIIYICMNMKSNAIMDNQQLCSLSREQLQVFISGKFGDGCIHTYQSGSTIYSTNCKFKEYLDFKARLLGSMHASTSFVKENGFCKTPIYTMRSRASKVLKYLKDLSIEDSLSLLDDLGLALWFYDDGSLHKTKLFYNLNTQSYSREIQEDLFIPFFNKLGIYPKITIERKQDGREFWYLRIGRYKGAREISSLLEKYPVNCYSYKRWSSETIQKWSKFQEELKSTGRDMKLMKPGELSNFIRKISL